MKQYSISDFAVERLLTGDALHHFYENEMDYILEANYYYDSLTYSCDEVIKEIKRLKKFVNKFEKRNERSRSYVTLDDDEVRDYFWKLINQAVKIVKDYVEFCQPNEDWQLHSLRQLNQLRMFSIYDANELREEDLHFDIHENPFEDEMNRLSEEEA